MRTHEVERLKSQLDLAASLGPETAIMTTQETVRAVLAEVDPVYVTADGSHVTGERAVDLYDDEKARSERAIGEREEQRQRAEAAEARVKELEAQNARLRDALQDIGTTAHCISKAGPLNTPDLATAWSKFDRIDVMCSKALAGTEEAK